MYYVLGLGITGQSVVRYLERHGLPFEVFDDNKAVDSHLFEPEHLVHVKEMIISPGVSLDHPLAKKVREHGIPIIGDIELFARHNKTPVVAITGTNGKSTVTTLVGEMVKAAGLKVLVGGNIGEPVLDKGEEAFDWIVLELSSFQLDSTFSLHPYIACILNITPDHLDRYENYAAYIASKQRIYDHADYCVASADDVLTWPKKNPPYAPLLERGGKGLPGDNVITFGLGDAMWYMMDNKYLSVDNTPLLDVNQLKIKGTHNWSNALAALAIGQRMGLDKSLMAAVLTAFPGLDHRCQWVRELNQVNWYNDSKGTNVGATLSAINGLGGTLHGDQKIVLLLGGQSKGADFADLCEPIKQHVRTVIVYGEDGDIINTMLKKGNVNNIQRAVAFDNVIALAQHVAQPGDVVLLSPACASWDMFDNFMHRGKVFTALVQGLS